LRNDRDLVALTVLALLLSGPRHPYEMHRLIIDTHKDFVTGLPRSMYHAVGRLERDRLIDVAETSRDGRRPERTVYRITDEGRAELTSRVRRLIERPDPDTTLFNAALSFLGVLPGDEAANALGGRAAALEGAVTAAEAHLQVLRGQLPRLLSLELEYEHSRLTAELGWVRGVLADLADGTLDWSDDLTKLMPSADN
jgi:DNA-binding PadR family transcriptional regulator